MKRSLSFLLTLLMLITSLPLNASLALAEELTAETATVTAEPPHPNETGMQQIAPTTIAELQNEHLHSYQSTVTQPTATTQGYTTYTCEVCGDSYVGDRVDSTGISLVLTPSDYLTVSRSETEQLACAPALVSYGDGNFAVVYLADDVENVETESSTTIICRLGLFHIDDPESGTFFDIATAGQTIGNVTIGATAPYEPNLMKLNDEELLILFNLRDTSGNYVYYGARFHIPTQTITSFEPLMLDGRTWNPANIALSYNAISDSADISAPSGSMVFTSKILCHEGYFYGYCGGISGGFGGILVRSTDGINWTSVLAPQPVAEMQGVIECGFGFLNDTVYFCMRDISSGVYHCSYRFSTGEQLAATTKLSHLTTSKPATFALDGQLYVIVNKNTGDDQTVGRRNTALFYRVDPETCNLVLAKQVFCADGCAYHCVEELAGVQYWCFHTDARRISPFTQGRSNLAFMPIPNLLKPLDENGSLDLDAFPHLLKNGCVTIAANEWQYGAVNLHYQVPLVDLGPQKEVTIAANSENKAYVAFFSKEMIAETTVAYAEGWSEVLILESGETRTLLIPADAKFLYVLATTAAGNDLVPESITFKANHTHSYSSITTQPTATTQGYTTYTCEVCGDSYVADYTDLTGFDSYDDAVKYLREQMVARVPSVTVRLYGVHLDENQVYNFRNDAWAHTGVPYEGDYIRQNCLTTSCSSVTGTDDKGIYTEMYFSTTWFTTAAQEAEVDAAVANLLAEWNLESATDYQKIKGAYDWVCTNVVYDHDNLYDSTYLLKHSAYAALIHGKAVCQGFASLFYRLCLELGVDCRVIIGYTDESHAWNIVKLDDKYYNMDPTYDRGTGNHYRYFLTTIYSFGGHDRNAEYETDAFNAAYPMATLPYVEKVAASGTLSNGMEWILDGDTGVLTVTGKGAIPDYRQWNAPWEPYSDSILGIELSEGITQVGDRAFAWCKNATYLSLPSTLQVICEYGFNNCRSLTEVDLPDGLTTLEFCAFSECSGLTGVYISGNLTNIGSSVFSNCPNIATIEFGEGFTHIADSMFSNTAIKELILPDTIVSIGSSAFARCEKLTYVRIPASVTYISHSAFINCGKLKQIGVVSDNPNYLSSFGVLFTKDAKTLVCFPAGMLPDRGTYTIPTGVTTIGDSAFYGASHVTRLVIPDSVTLIDDYAFAFCDGLYSVDIGPNVTRLGDTAFGFCTSLTSITFANPKMEIDNYCFTHCVKLKSFTFPAEIPALSPGTLTDCHAITEIEIPKNVSVIGSGCFQFVKSLKKVTIPANITKLENCAFFNCTALEEVVIEGNLSYMDWSAFDTCSNLKFVHFKGSVASFATTTDRELFRDCPVLFAVYFDDLATAKKVTSATAFGNLCKNALTVAVPRGSTGMSSFITTNYPIRSTISKDGVAYDLYSKHTCSWYQAGDPAYVGCEIRYSYRCTGCYAQKQTVGYSHSYSVTVTPATCTEDGKYTYICTMCGYSFEEIIPAEGHYYDYVITDPTCTEEGRYDYFCIYCDHTYTEPIPPLGHSFEAWYVTKEATCTTAGERQRDCLDCGLSEIETIPALGHNLMAYQAKEPTCTEIGWKAYESCLLCDYTTYTELPATGHDYESVVTKPTCTEQGFTTYTCHCGDAYVADKLPATGHSFGEWETVEEATCTENGEQRRDCTSCDHFETRVITATGHGYNAVVTKPTCTAEGYTTYTCHCGDSYVDDKVPATGHSFGEWETVKDATCTADGEQRRDCKNCDHYETKVIEAIGHGYNAVVTEPTCTTEGYTTYTCHCGDSYVADKIPATGHSFGEWYTVKEATCTVEGEQRRDCTSCDHYETQEIAATGHNYNAVVTQPTCTTEGYTTYTCHCGDSYVADKVPATGHSFGEWYTIKETTCTANGEQRRDCANCDHYETKAIEATGHSYTSVVTEPTCTTEGYTTYTCHCGDSYVADKIPATGHSFGEWYTIKETTCTENGTERRDCANCDHYETKAIEATGHSYNAVVTEPTCTTEGYTTYTCHCGDSYVADKIPATGHSFGEWYTIKETTCTENGTERRDCANCDHFETQLIASTGHSYTATVTKPTCTAEGYTTYTCHCGDSYVADKTPATGHSYSQWHTLKEASCTENGMERRECEACNHYETNSIPAAGHTLTAYPGKAPTCTEKGWTAYEACEVCDYTTYTMLPATGHSYQATVTKPTCTEEGFTTYTCHCGDSYVANKVPSAGHAWDNGVITLPPTEETTGKKVFTCTSCEEQYTLTLPTLEHTHRYEAVVTPPTCTEKGFTTYTCRCGDQYVAEILSPLGHGYTAVVTAPTCTEDGFTTYTCTVCGDSYQAEFTQATGHTYESVVTDPTCTEKGYVTYTCHCGDIYTGNYIPAVGHSWDEGVITVEPTEEQAGCKVYTCTVCGETEEETLPPLEHIHRYEGVVTEPTCAEQGFTTYTCRCGDAYVSDYTDAKGHSFGEWYTVTDPTCTADGTERRDCANCDHYETQAIAATGHKYDAIVTKPICTEQGYTTYTCHCGDSYVSDYVEPAGHAWNEWYDVAPGKEERTCGTCGETETRDKIPNYDVDGNGTVNQADVTLLMSVLVGNTETDAVFDFDFDGVLTIYDCVLLMQQIS